MERGDGSTSKSQRSLEMYPSPCSRLHDNIGNSRSQRERRDWDQVRQSTWNYSMFPRSNLQGDYLRESYCQRCLQDTQGSVGRTRILYQDLFTYPSLHDQARRRISWCRWLRQVNGSHLEKTQWLQSETSWGVRRPHDTDGSSSIFEDPKKNSGISKGPFNGDYQEWPVTRSFKTQSWASSTTARTSSG